MEDNFFFWSFKRELNVKEFGVFNRGKVFLVLSKFFFYGISKVLKIRMGFLKSFLFVICIWNFGIFIVF